MDLLNQTAEELEIPLHIVEKVVSFQFKDINQATKIYKEVEIASFGKFIMSSVKVKKKLNNLQKWRDKQENITLIERANKSIEFLKIKLNEFQGNMGGVEERCTTPGEVEGEYSATSSREIGDLQGLSN